jgi:hypothetical protein
LSGGRGDRLDGWRVHRCASSGIGRRVV